jgi:hypothetical protein
MTPWQPVPVAGRVVAARGHEKTADIRPPFEHSACAGLMAERHIVGPDHRSRKRCAVPGLTIRMMK